MLVPKLYSSIEDGLDFNGALELASVDEALSRIGAGKSLVLDEGGLVHDKVDSRTAMEMAGVEQTTFGMREHWKYPTVLVCRSASKKMFEAQIIARGIFRKLDSLSVLGGDLVGVIGLGALGGELARLLARRGHRVVGSDPLENRPDLGIPVVPVTELLGRCPVVLGCTGTDALAGFDWAGVSGRRLLISCSSSDVEFRSLARKGTRTEPYGPVRCYVGGAACTVLNGGFPINFDRRTEWEAFDEIVLTRRLVLEGLAQAEPLVGQRPRGVMLDPRTQLRIVTEWLEQVPDRDQLRIPDSLDESWFRRNSEGVLSMNEKPYALHHTTPGALTQMRRHTEPYTVPVMDMEVLVLPNVWSPAYDWSSLFYLENFPDVAGRDMLEIGCGTGVISLAAARKGARRVVAVDVNPDAVENARLNFERYGAKNAEASVSDLFGNVQGTFDVITWNAPYHGSRPADLLERGCADEDYRDIRMFFREVGAHLNPGGQIVFGFSESGDLPLVRQLISENGWRVRQELSDWRENYNCMLFTITAASKGQPDREA